ncbi:MAG: glycosyltransferase family 4 protein [Saprospiraceae bacterium]|nr:glycosyltransferase family 4 protein [Saprospiraceae bacterium]
MPPAPSSIAVIIPYRFVPPQNGGHHAAFGFCEALAQERDTVVISTTNNIKDNLPFRLELLFSDRFYKYFNPLIILRLWRFFYKGNIKTCIIQQPFFGLIALPVCRMLRIRFIVYVHNIEFQRFKTISKWWWRLLYPIERIIYRAADYLLFISSDDLEASIPIFKLDPEKCAPMPYGTRLSEMPGDRIYARQQIIKRHHYNKEELLILFFGPQSYQPNLDAVERIIYHINPILLQKTDFAYRILICGGGLPEHYKRLVDYKIQYIDYLGFVENIDIYIKAVDIVLNPINTGGGVKTKVIEAIALGTTVISSRTGAKGIDANACGEKLIIVEDEDNQAFVKEILALQQQKEKAVPATFYKAYNWERNIQNIFKKLNIIKSM